MWPINEQVISIKAFLQSAHGPQLKNLSRENIPEEVINVLSLGKKFSFPQFSQINKRGLSIIYHRIHLILPQQQDNVKLFSRRRHSSHLPLFPRNQLSDLKYMSNFVNGRSNIVFTSADAGSLTVVLNNNKKRSVDIVIFNLFVNYCHTRHKFNFITEMWNHIKSTIIKLQIQFVFDALPKIWTWDPFSASIILQPPPIFCCCWGSLLRFYFPKIFQRTQRRGNMLSWSGLLTLIWNFSLCDIPCPDHLFRFPSFLPFVGVAHLRTSQYCDVPPFSRLQMRYVDGTSVLSRASDIESDLHPIFAGSLRTQLGSVSQTDVIGSGAFSLLWITPSRSYPSSN